MTDDQLDYLRTARAQMRTLDDQLFLMATGGVSEQRAQHAAKWATELLKTLERLGGVAK